MQKPLVRRPEDTLDIGCTRADRHKILMGKTWPHHSEIKLSKAAGARRAKSV